MSVHEHILRASFPVAKVTRLYSKYANKIMSGFQKPPVIRRIADYNRKVFVEWIAGMRMNQGALRFCRLHVKKLKS